MFTFMFIRFHILAVFSFIVINLEKMSYYLMYSIHYDRFYTYRFTLLLTILFYYLILKYILDKNYLQIFLIQAIKELHPEPCEYTKFVEEGSKLWWYDYYKVHNFRYDYIYIIYIWFVFQIFFTSYKVMYINVYPIFIYKFCYLEYSILNFFFKEWLILKYNFNDGLVNGELYKIYEEEQKKQFLFFS